MNFIIFTLSQALKDTCDRIAAFTQVSVIEGKIMAIE
jgi:hypothetical protein